MIAMTDVYQEYGGDPPARAIAAAVLHAAVDQVVPEEREPYVPDYPDSNQIEPWHKWTERQHARADFLAIAAELGEGGSTMIEPSWRTVADAHLKRFRDQWNPTHAAVDRWLLQQALISKGKENTEQFDLLRALSINPTPES
jgi:2,4-dienoyl-CoA reductase-like NADH-dependent reductase (Old Yellow Enzyme family)